jgi:hypothetical protein
MAETTDTHILRDILFTGEAQFSRHDITNTRNSHFWAHGNLHAVAECLFQHQFQINVWCGVLGNQLIAPHINKERLAAPYYTNLLETELLLHLGDEYLQHMTNHFGRAVTEVLNEDYEGRWIGRCGPEAWRARSPYLTPLDFFLWGWLKSRVYYDGEPKARYQLVEALDEAAIGV